MSAPWPRLGVYKVEPTVWMVPSDSTPGSYWRVTWGKPAAHALAGMTCPCPAGSRQGAFNACCRHARLVNQAERADGYTPRPQPPPNVSALVD